MADEDQTLALGCGIDGGTWRLTLPTILGSHRDIFAKHLGSPVKP